MQSQKLWTFNATTREEATIHATITLAIVEWLFKDIKEIIWSKN